MTDKKRQKQKILLWPGQIVVKNERSNKLKACLQGQLLLLFWSLGNSRKKSTHQAEFTSMIQWSESYSRIGDGQSCIWLEICLNISQDIFTHDFKLTPFYLIKTFKLSLLEQQQWIDEKKILYPSFFLSRVPYSHGKIKMIDACKKFVLTPGLRQKAWIKAFLFFEKHSLLLL